MTPDFRSGVNRRQVVGAVCTVSAILLFASIQATFALAQYDEYEMKAAFLYNFLLYATWPESPVPEETLTIGILGKNPFGNAFDPVEGKMIGGRVLAIKRFGKAAPVGSIKKCNVLFMDPSIGDSLKRLLGELSGAPVMTVSEADGFLEAGGMVNLVKIGNNIKFEINMDAAERSGIKLRSRMLRLANRIVGNDMKAKQ